MKKLNQIRIEAGCSIADLARMMRVDQSTACSWLSGRVNPDADQRRKLAIILQVDPSTLDDEPVQAGRAVRFRGRLSTTGSKFRSQGQSSRGRARV